MNVTSPTLPRNVAHHMRRRKINKKGFHLSIMVCGRAGTGKSTFINTLCDDSELQPAAPRFFSLNEPTHDLEVRTRKMHLAEIEGSVIELTVVDTPGFGEKINNSDNADRVCSYLEAQFDEVLREEALVCRNPRFQDNRVHVCLYFLPPNIHGLRELDVDVMMKLSSRVNIIPIIGKADTMTDKELVRAKEKIMNDINAHNIPIFTFNYDLDDVESMEENEALREMLPFAVVGSNTVYDIGDEYVRARQYPWGFVCVEDPLHSDFVALRSVLLGSHIQELRDTTVHIIYEKYRTERIFKDPDLFVRIRETDEENFRKFISASKPDTASLTRAY